MTTASEVKSLTAFTHRVLIVAGVAILLFVLGQIAEVIILVAGGIVLATVLRVLMAPFLKHTRLSPPWALALVILILVILIGLGFWLLGGRVVQQVGGLQGQLGMALKEADQWLQGTPFEHMFDGGFHLPSGSVDSAFQIAKVTATALTSVAAAVIILFLGIYLAADPGLYVRGVCHLVPKAGRGRVVDALHASGRALRSWLLGQALSMAIVGLMTGVGLALLGVPSALAIGVITALAEFIPFVGPIAAAIPAVLMAFLVSPATAFHAFLLYVAIQQIEGNFTVPLAQKWAAALPPALTVAAVSIFGILFGFLGILFATPLMVALMTLVQKLYVEEVLHDETAKPKDEVAAAG